ncbi:hypothetical protein FB451DRAFT_1518057 [Mycena latifolia]|nr:hypothetical protein FB451DRAFT_1518057 [Mycena latifolia]
MSLTVPYCNEWAVDRIVIHYGRRSTSLFEVLWKSGDKSWMPYGQAKRLEVLEEFANPQFNPMLTTEDFFGAAILTPAGPLLERYLTFNRIHSALKRITPSHFRINIPGIETGLMLAQTIRHFADYNVVLCTRDDFPSLMPSYYVDFTVNMNHYDDSLVGSLGLFDHEISEHYLAPGKVAVSRIYYEKAERLRDLELACGVRYYKDRQGKHKVRDKLTISVGIKAAMEKFSKRCKVLDAASVPATPAASVATEDMGTPGPSGTCDEDEGAMTD